MINVYEKIFDVLGIDGDIKSVLEDNDYSGIDFGEKFKGLCADWDMDYDFMKKCITDYALYEVYREECLFDNNDLELMEQYQDELVLQMTLGDVLDEYCCDSPQSYYESYGCLLNEKEDEGDKKEREKIMDAIGIKEQNGNRGGSRYIFKEGLFFKIYKDKRMRYKQPLNKVADKIDIVSDIDRFKEATLGFLEKLKFLEEMNFTRDLHDYENTTNMLFVFNLYRAIRELQADFEYEADDGYLNALSSLILIENITLKLHIMNNLVEKEDSREDFLFFSKSDFRMPLHKIYILSLVYPMLIKEFIKRNLYTNAEKEGVTKTNVRGENKTEIEKLKHRVYMLERLGKIKIYNLAEMQSRVAEVEVENRHLFKRLYLKVSKLQQEKGKLINNFNDYFDEKINIFEEYGLDIEYGSLFDDEVTDDDYPVFENQQISRDDAIKILMEGSLYELLDNIIQKWRREKTKKNGKK
ncbi:MAG: hypothetical protein GT589_01040 [Peptoclostridium sp.]|uniref:hypothetical protein n=1 Tax=Peptoclostridium sp. TaxID=1904860 RepID=UPI00139B95F8|nr:hypothetical protein [Peptoclostridium sp.]MZQ74729.1 hypothetical protein [Peptoclostridium sp.]